MAQKDVSVTWKPYQIDPGTAVQGESFHAYCKRRWGGSGWTNHLRSEGSKDGATFANWKWWPNTTRAHQWIEYFVSTKGMDTDKLNNVLFRALYEDGLNISQVDTLVALGKKESPECEDDLREYLENNKGVSKMKQQIDDGRSKYNIRGVPFFVVGLEGSTKPPIAFSGAQSAETFRNILQEFSEEDSS